MFEFNQQQLDSFSDVQRLLYNLLLCCQQGGAGGATAQEISNVINASGDATLGQNGKPTGNGSIGELVFGLLQQGDQIHQSYLPLLTAIEASNTLIKNSTKDIAPAIEVTNGLIEANNLANTQLLTRFSLRSSFYTATVPIANAAATINTFITTNVVEIQNINTITSGTNQIICIAYKPLT
jgi:hypothetical protein